MLVASPMMSVLVGVPVIAKALGCSVSTVLRMKAAGEISLFRRRPLRNSPLCATRAEVDRVRRAWAVKHGAMQ